MLLKVMSSPSKHQNMHLRVCNMETWQANAFSYFKCWCKNTLSVPSDPWSSLNSPLVRDLLSLSSPALISLPFSSLLCSHEFPLPLLSLPLLFPPFSLHTPADGPCLRQLSPQLSPVPLRVPSQSMIWSCLQCFIKALHTSPRGKRPKPIISPPQPFLKWKPSQVANRGRS